MEGSEGERMWLFKENYTLNPLSYGKLLSYWDNKGNKVIIFGSYFAIPWKKVELNSPTRIPKLPF